MKSTRTALALGGALTFVLSGCSASSTGGRAVALPSTSFNQAVAVDQAASPDLRKQFADTPKSVNAYWTSDRFKKAKPNGPGPKTQPPIPTPTTVPTTAAPKPKPTPAPKPKPTTPAKPKPTKTTPAPKPRTTTPAPKPRTTTPAPKPRTTTPAPKPKPTTRPPAPKPTAPTGNAPYYVAPAGGKVASASSTLPSSTSGSLYPKYGLSRRTNGRLYFEEGGQPFVCSATVVNSPHGNLVATAGHCVWNTSAATPTWNSKFIFIPGDSGRGASHPYGKWYAAEVFTNTAFQHSARSGSNSTYGDGWHYDFAMLRMQNNDGRTIQSVTGGQGMAFNTVPRAAIVIGYPTAAPFDGSSERYCSTPALKSRLDGYAYGDYDIDCAMTPGCSGGAWMQQFSTSSGAGYLIGVTSLAGEHHDYSSHFGPTALSTYRYAINGK